MFQKQVKTNDASEARRKPAGKPNLDCENEAVNIVAFVIFIVLVGGGKDNNYYYTIIPWYGSGNGQYD